MLSRAGRVIAVVLALTATAAVVKVARLAFAGPAACRMWAFFGTEAMEGCKKCDLYMPGKVDKCMGCGKHCYMKVCMSNKFNTSVPCVKSEEFLTCDKECLKMSDVKGEVRKYEHAGKGTCSKYEKYGKRWVMGCQWCEKEGLTQVDTCLGCGKKCYKQFCSKENRSEACKTPLKYPEMVNCTKGCYEKDTGLQTAPKDSCSAKYAKWGDVALKGCAECQTFGPTKVDTCMLCGRDCYDKMCKDNETDECFKEVVSCAKQCVIKKASTFNDTASGVLVI